MVQAKQIVKNTGALIRLLALATGAANNTVITTALTTALGTAGNDSNTGAAVSVPLQIAGTGGVGVITTTSTNRVKIIRADNKNDVIGANNAEVYARLTEASGVYTLNYFTLQGGVETAHAFAATINIDFLIPYRFDFARLPLDALLAVPATNVSDDATAGAAPKSYTEQLIPTATNTLPVLTRTPDTIANLILYINGIEYDSFGGAAARFSLATRTITWNPANGTPPFSITTSDRVIASYTSLE